jgi:hypothetical protein
MRGGDRVSLYDQLGGPPIGVARAAEYVHGPGEASRTKQSKITRWLVRGLLVNGTRLRLAGVKAGGVWYTTERHIDEFIRATTAGAGVPAVPERTPAERDRASRAASTALAAAGW